jgi:hypothetical protein
LIPLPSIVEIQPMGRGMMIPVNNLYKTEASVLFVSNSMSQFCFYKLKKIVAMFDE